MPEASAVGGPILVAPERLEELIFAETGADEKQSVIIGLRRSLEDALRKNSTFLTEVFRHYGADRPEEGNRPPSTPVAEKEARGGARARRAAKHRTGAGAAPKEEDGQRVDLRGLARLYRDCRLRRLRLRPVDLEWAYDEACAELGPEVGRGLPLTSFVLALLHLSVHAEVPADGRQDGGEAPLHARFGHLVHRHLAPYAMKGRDDLFYVTVHSPGLEPVLAKHERMLRVVFERYAAESAQPACPRRWSPEAAQRRRPVRSPVRSPTPGADDPPAIPEDAELEAPEGAAAPLPKALDWGSCLEMLEHAKLPGGALDARRVRRLLRGVARGFADGGSEDEVEDREAKKGRGVADVVAAAGLCAARQGGIAAGLGAAKTGGLLRRAVARQLERGRADAADGQDGAQKPEAAEEPHVSFCEFVDLLVALVMYKEPGDPEGVSFRAGKQESRQSTDDKRQ